MKVVGFVYNSIQLEISLGQNGVRQGAYFLLCFTLELGDLAEKQSKLIESLNNKYGHTPDATKIA